MTICCLGDLVLDVIVRLEQPLATGADATSRSCCARAARPRTSRPGSPRSAAARGSRQARRRRCRACSRRRGCATRRRAARAGRAERERRHRLARLTRRRADDVPRPRRRHRAPPDEIDAALARGLRPPPRLRATRSLREPVRFAAAAAIECARAQGARVSVDLSSWSAIRDCRPRAVPRARSRSSRPTSCSRTRRRTRSSAGRSRHALDPQARRRRVLVRRRRASLPLPVERWSTTTGAGDALAAGWIVGGPDLALEAAARCVQQRGLDARHATR